MIAARMASPGTWLGSGASRLFAAVLVALVVPLLQAERPAKAAATYPTTPPAQICGNASVLNGPATQPAGSVRVDPGQNLNTLTQAQPAGTTFWLAPGTHTLGTGQYNQVIPKDNDVYLGAPGAILDGANLNRYAFVAQATGVSIQYLTIQNFGPIGSNNNEGVVNHDGGSGWTIKYNTIQGNAGAGVFLGSNNTLSYNCILNNGQYGFSMYKATQGSLNAITIDHNEIAGNNTYDWEAKISGCGCSGGGKFWDAHNVTVTANWVHHNKSVGLWADTNDVGFVFDGNYINDNDSAAIFYEISYNARITNNTIERNAIVQGKAFAARNDNFPVGAIYLSESGGDSRVNGGALSTLDVSGNNLVDNWGGVVLWENADRFCGSPANTSGGYCTLVNPAAANFNTCVSGTINSAPQYSDCRWKTQNVSVHDNVLRFLRANVGCTTTGCGQQAIVSNWGTYPTWSPYQGTTVQNAITSSQNNHFANNTYIGDWTFTPHNPGNFVTFSAWQGAAYGQDAGSTFTPGSTQPTTTTTVGPTPTTVAPTTTTTVAPTTTTVPRPNYLDTGTATLEGSIGHWRPWYGATPSRSTLKAKSGAASLRVEISAQYGWGVQLDNWPGFDAAPGPRTIAFAGLLGSAGPLDVRMTVRWKSSSGGDLQVDTLSIPTLATSWRDATMNVTAPAGTDSVTVEFSSASGRPGDALYVDQVFVG